MSESIRYNYIDLVSINSTVGSSATGSVSNLLISNFTSGTLSTLKIDGTVFSTAVLWRMRQVQ